MFQKQVVIDGRGHLIGRLASIVAKEVLNGTRTWLFFVSLPASGACLFIILRWIFFLE
jgi:ribosomal protein L13